MSGEGAAEAEDFRCFIASAAYGTNDHPDLELLRRFRDKYLLTSEFGTAMVDLYYNWSPPLAQLIKDYPVIQKPIKLLLKPIVALLDSLELQTQSQGNDAVDTESNNARRNSNDE